jgi:hypothetical protein
MNLPYLVYSHSEYFDVLRISAEFLGNNTNKTLLIDTCEATAQTDFAKLGFNKVLFYDDKLPYAKKLADALTGFDNDYVLFTHEIDIALSRNEGMLDRLVDWMRVKNIDRVELQVSYAGGNTGNYTRISLEEDVSNWIEVTKEELTPTDQYLQEHSIPGTYRYNVNPSIWKLSSFKELLQTLHYKAYRQIESEETEDFCKKYKIYSLHTETPLFCGYFKCAPLYKFFHITHWQKFVKYNNTFTTKYGLPYSDAAKEYKDIIDRHNLLQSKRDFA